MDHNSTKDKTENSIKVSVIIPVYNVEKYLAECLDSVLAQTLEEIEIICIDDASPDGCPAILDRYAAGDTRISVIHLDQNRGQGYGRNLGLAKARGEYVYFLDSDDMITPRAMEELYAKAGAGDLDGIFFDSEVIFDEESLVKRYASYPAVRCGKYPGHPVTGQELFELFIEQNEWTSYIQRQFWRREFLLEEKIENPVRAEHEDEVFAFKAILAARRVKYIKDRYFIRRYRRDSVMTVKPAPKNFHGYLTGFYFMERFVRERGIKSEAADRNMARLYEKMVRYYREMSGEYDLDSEMETLNAGMPDVLTELYHFFAESQKSWLHYGALSAYLLEKASQSSHIYIYGAGRLAEQVYLSLEMKGYIIDGFIVTKKEGNPSAFHGRPVTELKETPRPEGALVIIAVTDGYREEISEALERSGWEYMFFRE